MRRSNLLFQDDSNPTPAFAALLAHVGIPGSTLTEINQALQVRFFQKNPDGSAKERWDLEKVSLPGSKNQLMRHLAACGFVMATEPEQKRYARAGWPGALVIRAAVRLSDLFKAWESGTRWNETIVFGGKRPLQPDKEDIIPCCKALGIQVNAHTTAKPYVRLWDTLKPETELGMMRFLWEAAAFEESDREHGALSMPAEMRNVPITFVDAPMKPPLTPGGPGVRPSTEDTILAWLSTEPEPGTMLVSSGAPYGMAQDEAFATLLAPKGHEAETFGHSAPDLGIELYMRELAGCVNRIKKARLG